MSSNIIDLQPPRGYVIKKYIGAGAWKIAFHASLPGSLLDVALLCYHGSDTAGIADDVAKSFRLIGEHEFARYITRVYDIHIDKNNRVWIAEELLTESLMEVKPLRDTRRFCEIARDLCRGLSYIHSKKLVHRDLKLDNCGLDDDGTAKIFDIGSVTSEFSQSLCTILTRAPELLNPSLFGRSNVEFKREADIWALGATLLALRTGAYPFVYDGEIEERAALGERLAKGDIDRKKYTALKIKLDQAVSERAIAAGAEDRLRAQVGDYFQEGARRLMLKMLGFSVSERGTAENLQADWAELADAFATPVDPSSRVDHWQATRDFLEAVAAGELIASPRQIQRCKRKLHQHRKSQSDEIDNDEGDDLLETAEARVQDYWSRVSPTIELEDMHST